MKDFVRQSVVFSMIASWQYCCFLLPCVAECLEETSTFSSTFSNTPFPISIIICHFSDFQIGKSYFLFFQTINQICDSFERQNLQ